MATEFVEIDESQSDDGGIYDVWARFRLSEVEAIHDGFARLARGLAARRAGNTDYDLAVSLRGLALLLMALGFLHVKVVQDVLDEVPDP